MQRELIQAYKFWREPATFNGYNRGVYAMASAAAALQHARADVAAGKARYPRGHGNGIGAASDNGLQWCENPEAIGLRFVGWSNELRNNSRDSNYGYYTDSDGMGETYRGAVYQFPARDGRPVYVAGYREGSTGKNRRDWTDASGVDGSARLNLSDLFYGDIGEERDGGTARDAAMRADSIAEHAAENERDYKEAWSRGNRYADLGENIKSARRMALKLIREIKAAAGFNETICATLREKLETLRESIEEARKERAELVDVGGWWAREFAEPFNEGAGETILRA